jgi:DNA polymerase-3 subunit gamma/tau
MMAPSLFSEAESPIDEPTEPAEPESHGLHGTDSSATVAAASLYRKYRPQSFHAEELVGQDHITRALKNAVVLQRVAHAYLFSGPRGTGKTTTARVLAKAINCLAENPEHRPCNACASCLAINTGATPDLIEIDAASNRGIDDIRDLRDRVRYAPAQLTSKVYIIDEAHQITGAAANAFLKTLEEPPSHTRFILATTDPEELLPTIVSRCQRFEFRRLSGDDMTRRLRLVANREDIAIADDALRLIARQATGSLRDALGLLERLALLATSPPDSARVAPIDVADVQTALGLSRNERIEELVAAIARSAPGDALGIAAAAVDAGEDPRQLNRQLLSYLRMLLLERSGAPSDADDRAQELAAKFSLNRLADLARRFGEIDFTIKHAPYPQLPLEIALVEATATPAVDHSLTTGHASPAPESPPTEPAPPTALRDRVRANASMRGILQGQPARQAPNEPALITPLHPPPVEIELSPADDAAAATADVEQIAHLWPNVRADVKALNRRIEALLSEVDPVAVTGNQITLAVPYPFHRDKLNTDEVRDTVAGVLSRLLGREVSLVCILRGELPAVGFAGLAPASTAADSRASETDDAVIEEEQRAQARLRAAKNIFDAEEIPSANEAQKPSPEPDATEPPASPPGSR